MDNIEVIQQLNVNIDAVIEALQAHTHTHREKSNALWRAFGWEMHPYRFDFWHKEACKQRQGIPLSRKAVEELERILVIKTLT